MYRQESFATMTVWLIFALISVSQSSFVPVLRQFVPTSNFDTPNNWDLLRTPCTNDIIQLDDEKVTAEIAVHIDDHLTLSNTTLFLTGELIFGEDAALIFEESPLDRPVLGKVNNSDFCHEKGERIQFRGTKREFWRNPSNWKVLTEGYNPVLHVEMVPTQIDAVFFDPHSTFNIEIETEVVVGQLSFGNQVYSNDNFSLYLDTIEGGLQFHPGEIYDNQEEEILAESGPINEIPPLITITGMLCNDHTGCISNNMKALEMQLICSHVQCTSLPCSRPIRPKGHCCDMCGAKVVFNADKTFNFQQLSGELRLDAATETRTFSSFQKVADNTYQLIVVPSEWTSDSTDHLMDVVEATINRFTGAAGVIRSSLVLTTSVINRSAQKGVGAAFLVLFLLALAVGAIYYLLPSVRSGRFRLVWLKSVGPKVALWRSKAVDDEAIQLRLDDNTAEMSDVSPMPERRKNDSSSSLTESMQFGIENPSYSYSGLSASQPENLHVKEETKDGETMDESSESFANPTYNPSVEE